MDDERRPPDDGCSDAPPEDAPQGEPARRDRYDRWRRGQRGGSGLMALAIAMLLIVAGLLGVWWWTQVKGEALVPPAAEEAVDEAVDPADDSNGWLDIPSFRGPSDEAEPGDPEEGDPEVDPAPNESP